MNDKIDNDIIIEGFIFNSPIQIHSAFYSEQFKVYFKSQTYKTYEGFIP